MGNNGPKPLNIAQKATALHAFGVQDVAYTLPNDFLSPRKNSTFLACLFGPYEKV